MNWLKAWDWLNIVASLSLAFFLSETAIHTNPKAALDGFLAGFLVMIGMRDLTKIYGGKK